MYRFAVEIKDGALHGQYGQQGAPASVTFDGRVQPDGTATLFAHGHTGDPDYAVGHVTRSSRYSYTMRGRFENSVGTMTRVETRPCEARFVKQ